MSEFKTVDCRGLACPQPVIDTKAALAGATAPVLVIVDNEASCTNVRRLAEGQGANVTVDRRGDEFRLTIVRGADAPPAQEPAPDPETRSTLRGRTVVYVSSEGMGSGDDGLGATLMESFLDTLSHFEGEVSHVIFVNAGAKLAVEGSPVLDQVRHLEELGARVLVCGTCLDFFKIKDKLAAGSVSNMYEIIETLAKAGRVLRP
jgi:selenium metabolism protein YedF